MIERNDPCWCGSGKKWKKCHYPNAGKETNAEKTLRYFSQYHIVLKNPEQITGIRKACQLTAFILQKLCEMAKEGVTTEDLNAYAMELHQKNNAKPAPLGYGHPPYPKAICTSINEVICHGIPEKRKLQNGDIMNIDVSSIYQGFYGDCSAMVCIGEIEEEKKRVVDTSYETLMEAIAILKPGILVSEIGDVIEAVAAKRSCSVVHEFVAHGVGLEFHEPPQIPHSYNQVHIPLEEGMTFTIEPMINAGVRNSVIDADEWTARTADGKPSAQWEHTLLITKDGHEILTKVSENASFHSE